MSEYLKYKGDYYQKIDISYLDKSELLKILKDCENINGLHPTLNTSMFDGDHTVLYVN